MKTNLLGLRKTQWKKNLKGLYSFGGRDLTDAEVRHIINYAITKGYEWDSDIPDYEVRVLLGMEPKFKIRAIYDNGQIKKDQVFDAEWRERGSSYKHKENILIWSSSSKVDENGRRFGTFAYMDDSIFGNDEVYPIFEIVNPDESGNVESEKSENNGDQ